MEGKQRPLQQRRAGESISGGGGVTPKGPCFIFKKITKDLLSLCGTGSKPFSLWSVGYFWVVPCGFSRACDTLRSRDPSEKAFVLRS